MVGLINVESMIDSSFKKANILIVDDQEPNVEILHEFLEMQGYLNVKSTTDPREVLSLYKSFQPDLILLDLTMPHLTGFEVMEQLKSILGENSFLPILVLTADITNEAKIKALSGGASDFLTKPFDLLEVGLRIKNLLFSSFLQQQLVDQNRLLDEKVNERTRELLLKNVELNLAKEKAEASDRLKTSFINNISHEIRTPLNGILGFGQILADHDLEEEEKNRYLYILNESSERLINTVTNFLEISMITSGNQEFEKKEFLPETIISDVAKHFQPACDNKKLNLIIEQSADLQDTLIYSDRELLFKIFRHLMDNALKFTAAGSIVIGCKRRGNDLVFSVQDTGKGITDVGKNVIFNSFSQEDNSYSRGYEGCGLGLTISKGLVELLGGSIWVESAVEVGSTFFFTIPIQGGENISKAEVFQSENDSEIKTILVAEDDEINFLFINILLRSETIRILHARDGQEAIDLCRIHPNISAALIDLKMPFVDGFEASRQIKAMDSSIPILAITAYTSSEDKQRALDAGCDEFITKPVNKEQLTEKLAKYGIVIGGKIKY